MENQSSNSTSKDKRDRLIGNAVEAYATLFRSVLDRTQREYMSRQIKKGIQAKKLKDEYEKHRVQV